MTVTGKLNKVNSIVIPVLIIFFLGAMAYFVGFLSFLEVDNGKVDSIYKTPIYGSLILIVAIIPTAIYYIKMCITIHIDSKGIKLSNIFKTEFIKWSEIQRIELIGKSQGTASPSDSANLILHSGRHIDLIASYYENMPTIRKSLEQIIECVHSGKPIELNPEIETPKVDPTGFVNLSGMTKYSGNHFLSLNGLMIYLWTAFSIYLLMTIHVSSFNSLLGMILVLIGMFGIFYGFLGFQLHYFYADSKYLVIKNHVWPWKKHVYRIENIKQVVIETPYKRSTSLRVITKDYHSRLYPSGSLRGGTWKDLVQGLENLKVSIRTETAF